MWKSYFTIAFRNLIRNNTYTLINILGLALGTTICTMIFLLIRHDMSYDKFHTKMDRIYRVVTSSVNADGLRHYSSVPYPTGPTIADELGDIEAVTQIHWDYEQQINIGNERFYQDGVMFADSLFFDVFDFDVLIGNPHEALKQPEVAFLTESLADKYFHDPQNAIGKTIRLSNEMDLEVKGIIADPPETNHLPFTIIVSYPSLNEAHIGGFDMGWGTNLSCYTYVLLPPNMTKEQADYQLEGMIKKLAANGEEEEGRFDDFTLTIQPLSEVQYDKQYADSGVIPIVNTNFLLILGFIGLFIIILASINFVNLSTALSVRRSKEVGVRKVLGANRRALVFQFLGESAIITFIALILSMAVVERVLPVINQFLKKELIFDPFSDPIIAVFLLGILVIITILSGLYPSFVLSGYKPARALKGRNSGDKGKSLSLRKILVSFQFFISQSLIIVTIIIIQQLIFFRTKPLGFDSEAVLTLDLYERDSLKLLTLKNQLLEYPSVRDVTFGIGVPTSQNSIGTTMYIDSGTVKNAHRVRIKAADEDYLETFSIPVVAGQWYPEGHHAKSGIVLNETAVRTLGFQSPDVAIGQYLHLGFNGLDAPIMGVVKDFHTRSLHSEIAPVVMLPFPFLYYEAGIKINTSDLPQTIDFLKHEWDIAFPGYVFNYGFMDDYIAELYDNEARMLTISKVASFIAILIGCLGLYGLVSFIAVQRTKEVGIRKTFGASIGDIVYQFSREFMILLTISFIISVPIVWYMMDKWLQSFAYKINIKPWYFMIGFLATLVIAGLTISYKSVKAAYANPIDALKEE